MKTYKIVAKGHNVAQSIEMLGDAFGTLYVSRSVADAMAADLQADAPGHGYDGVTYVVVEEEKRGDLDEESARIPLPAYVGVRHDGVVDILDGNADGKHSAAAAAAAGNYHAILPLQTWDDVASAACWQGHGRDAMRRAVRRALGIVVASEVPA